MVARGATVTGGEGAGAGRRAVFSTSSGVVISRSKELWEATSGSPNSCETPPCPTCVNAPTNRSPVGPRLHKKLPVSGGHARNVCHQRRFLRHAMLRKSAVVKKHVNHCTSTLLLMEEILHHLRCIKLGK